MKKIKRNIIIMLVCLLTIMQAYPTYAENTSEEWYEMVDEEFEIPELNGY